MTNIIFLDFDGVINRLTPVDVVDPHLIAKKTPFPAHRDCIANLNKLISSYSCKIVISSDWRRWHSLAEIKKMLADLEITGPVIDKIPIIHGFTRGFEIQCWLRENKDLVQRLVILDDRNDMDSLLPFLVETDVYCGLTEKKAEEAMLILDTDTLQKSFPERLLIDQSPNSGQQAWSSDSN